MSPSSTHTNPASAQTRSSRRRFLATIAASAAFASPAMAQAAGRPNFLILLTDDQRFDTIRALGHPEIHTPNMDRLVRRGVTFTHAMTQGGLTGAICMPSRAAIHTGRSMFEVHRAIVDRQNAPDPEVRTFGEHLRGLGYTTFHTGKWHNGPALFQRTFSAGAAIFFGGMTDQLKVPVFDYAKDGRYPKERMRTETKFSSELFADAAVEFLAKHPAGTPFVCDVAFTSPHDPRMAPTRFSDLYPPEKIRLPANFLPEHPFDNGELKVRDELLAPFPRTGPEIRRHIAAYYAMVSEVDHQIGRILDALDRSPHASNTYIVFAGDNGLAVGQHGLLGKQNLYDHSLRVPLVIAGPGVPSGKRNASLCHPMDLAPTICELAGTRLDSATQSMSLAECLRKGTVLPRQATISAYRDVQRAIRTRDWKLIRYTVGGRRTTQLFDLRKDPLERNNLADLPRHARLVAELETRMQGMLREAGEGVGSARSGPRADERIGV